MAQTISEKLPHIGTHLSVAKGYEKAGRTALAIGADTFSLFLRNPRGSRAKPLDEADIGALRTLLAEHGFAPLVAHAPYTMNLASPKPDNRAFSATMLAEDLVRMEYLPGNYYNLHPGTAGAEDNGMAAAGARVAEALNGALTENMQTTVLLETMSGSGHEVGGRFEDLRGILAGVTLPEKVGVCLDTCHLFAAGYNVRDDLDGVLAEFDRVVGLEKLKAVHLNDSMFALGLHKDRHAPLGKGELGLDAVIRILRHPALKALPFITETPFDDAGHKAEIAMVKQAYRKAEKAEE